MFSIMIAPNRYIQGPGILSAIGDHINYLGRKAFFIGGPTAISIVKECSAENLKKNNIESVFESYSGDCTRAITDELAKKAKEFGADIIVGTGGGRTIDTAKAVSHELDSHLVIAPTVASNDAPCSALSVQYDENHMIDRFLILRRNPDVVLVDSRVIAHGPIRLFVAGMGDALATWFEANTCTKSMAKNFAGGLSTSAALSLARLCYDTLMEYGISAKIAVENHTLTPAVERVIEANILLSGIGFESSGISAAHGIHEGLHVMEGTEDKYHGELVAFGTLAQLVMENYPMQEINKVLDFCIAVGLPVTLDHLGVRDVSEERVMKAADVACMEGLTTHNSYLEINPELILGSILGADALGRARLGR